MTRKRPNEFKYNRLSSIIIANRGYFDPNRDTYSIRNTKYYTSIPEKVKARKKLNKDYKKNLDYSQNIVDLNGNNTELEPLFSSKESIHNVNVLTKYLSTTIKRKKQESLNVTCLLVLTEPILRHINKTNNIKKTYKNQLKKIIQTKILKKAIPEANNEIHIYAIFNDAIKEIIEGKTKTNQLYKKWNEIPKKGTINLTKYNPHIKKQKTIYTIRFKSNYEYSYPCIELEDRLKQKYHIRFLTPEDIYNDNQLGNTYLVKAIKNKTS